MNFSAIEQQSGLRQGASASQIAELEDRLGFALPASYKAFLRFTNGVLLDSGVSIYPTDVIEERNSTFEVATYCRDYLLIGDDSGGTGILISRIDNTPVGKSGFGDLTPPFEMVHQTLLRWVESGLVWIDTE